MQSQFDFPRGIPTEKKSLNLSISFTQEMSKLIGPIREQYDSVEPAENKRLVFWEADQVLAWFEKLLK